MLDLLSLEPLDEFNRPFRIKEPTFAEVEVEERKKLEQRKGKGKDGKDEEEERLGQGASLSPASLDLRMMVNFIDQLDNRTNAMFKEYLITLQESQPRTYKEMSTISTLLCMADRSLTVKPRDDLKVERLDMSAYYTFAAITKKLHRDFFKKVLGKEKVDREVFEKFAGIVYRLIYQKAYQVTNAAYDKYLRGFFQIIFCCRWKKRRYVTNLWDRIEVEPMSPYYAFDGESSIWRTYQTNERGDRGIFRSMDRIKMLHNMLLDSMNVYELRSVDIIEGVLPLHDRFLLEGESKVPLFEDFPDIKNFCDPPDVAEKKGKIMGLLTGMADTASSSDFTDVPLKEQISLRFFSPSTIDVEAIQNYFGEKIALYFEFLQYHTKSLYFISWLGVIIFIVDNLMIYEIGFDTYEERDFKTSNEITSHDIALMVFKMNRLLLAVATVVWSSFYLEFWKRKQKFFAIKYGMTEFENKETKRPNFTGEYIRDLSSSSFNFIHYGSGKRILVTILTYTCVVLLVVLSMVIAVLCLYLRKLLARDGSKNAILVYFVPSMINYIAVKLIESLFYKLAMYFNMKENHETLTKFEDSLINKIFTFNFFNAFNSFFIIGFVKYIQTLTDIDLLFGSCVNIRAYFSKDLSCYEELEGQTFSFFILAFLFNFLEVFAPIVLSCFRKKFIGIPRRYAWGRVDEIIEDEFKKEEYMASAEIDGVLKDYSEVTIQFSSLSFFGMIFPLSFIMSYFTSILEIHLDKIFYMYYIRRPVPRSAADIGSWEYILEAISFFTIFVNAGLVVFTAEAFKEINYVVFPNDKYKTIDTFSVRMKYFVFVVFVLLFIKMLLAVLIPDIPDNLQNIIARHENIISRTIKKPRESNANGKSGFPIHPLPNQIPMVTDLKKNQLPKGQDDEQGEQNPEPKQEPEENQKEEPKDEGLPHFSIAKELNYKPEDKMFSVD